VIDATLAKSFTDAVHCHAFFKNDFENCADLLLGNPEIRFNHFGLAYNSSCFYLHFPVHGHVKRLSDVGGFGWQAEQFNVVFYCFLDQVDADM